MSQASIRGRGLSHAFGSQAVLCEVDVELGPGQLAFVLGPNGAGKTTLVRVLSGVLRSDRGAVELTGRALDDLSRREVARRIGVVPQELSVPFPFTVREMVAMGRAPHLGPFGHEGADDRRRVARALQEQGLTGLADRLYPTLSGGEKQRVALARVAAQDTPLLLLDEPTAHMDLGHRAYTFDWLRRWIAAEPEVRAGLVVTHDLLQAARSADQIWLLADGRVAASGPPAEVLTQDVIGNVFDVDVEVSNDADGRPWIVARGSRIDYTGAPHE